MSTPGFLGIDAGTQGLSAIFTNRQLEVLGVGEGSYDMLPELQDGCYEQSTSDWEAALVDAVQELNARLATDNVEPEVLAVGISGQMHGEVLCDDGGQALGPVRLWCDGRNEAEGHELTSRFGVKMPKRITAARWLWTLRNHPNKAAETRHITTPAGWIARRLTGQWNLGIGDAAGMFPIDQTTLNYDQALLESFDKLVGDPSLAGLGSLLPSICKAGEEAGSLDAEGARLLGLPVGIPVAAAEGDQPAALAGSLIADAGMVSCSFGTSVCANSVGDRAFSGVSDAVDHFCAADGKPINMVWLRNGTTFMNAVVRMFGGVLGNGDAAFDAVMPQLVASARDCGGLQALPFMDDEPGLGISQGGTAMLFGLNDENATPGNAARAALLSTMFNLRMGCEVLDQQSHPRTEIVLSGGLTRTPELGQILADVFRCPVSLLDSAAEGTAWGAALLAAYRHAVLKGETCDWSGFLARLRSAPQHRFEPCQEAANQTDQLFARYRRLIQTQTDLATAVD
ncbi:MAG: xylulokinase [Pirellulaceae bacterium]